MTKTDKEVYEEAVALANEPETSFQLRTAFTNFRNKRLGLNTLYTNFRADEKFNGPAPETISKRAFDLEAESEKAVAGDFELEEQLQEVHNNMNMAFKEAGYDIDTYDKFVSFQKQVMNHENPNKFFAEINQNVRKVIDKKSKEDPSLIFMDVEDADVLAIEPEFYANTIGDRHARRYMGMLRDFDAFNEEEREDLMENGRYYRVNQQHARPGYFAMKHGANTPKYLALERKQIEHGMRLKKRKVHSKMVGFLSVLVAAGTFGCKYMELGFRDWNEQRLTFAQRLHSLETDYFPTEQSIHDHFRMKEWFYKSYRTMYGEPPEEDDDDDDDFDF
eukprot:CAMPEP_0117426774 /NCGR_PEP_ID=MMETSP0758-20121206/6796_1 /TAXON_ID=63605 /ORGANISM="Percolomonas cosmopolitus, Strain AE-1 (ATCC 50343)" /LENGTH=332 /DNA_ID=CAMNT_0005212095 /DNA_START=8 /DNA_END=1006 /DNA_ORIENTATION=-